MPCLELSTNVRIADQEDLMRSLSACVCKGLNKSETYMMVLINDARPMHFSGSSEPAAYVTLRAIGLRAESIKTLAASLTDLIEAKLGIDRQRIYIVFMEAEMNKWAWDGALFA